MSYLYVGRRVALFCLENILCWPLCLHWHKRESLVYLLHFTRGRYKSDNVFKGEPPNKHRLCNLEKIFLLWKNVGYLNNPLVAVKRSQNLRMTPFLSFFWNLGSVENIRHRVDTTTKRQETTAITWGDITNISNDVIHFLAPTGVWSHSVGA